MPSIKLRGWGPLFNQGRAQVDERLRTYGANPTLIQKFNNELQGREEDFRTRFKEAIKHDPRWQESLERFVVGTPEWNAEITKIAESVDVLVTFQNRGAVGTIAVIVGDGFPLFTLEG